MKTIDELLKQEPLIDGFSDIDDIFNQFNQKRANERIIYANYTTPAYEGYAFVLFEQDGKLYEVNGSHCSCFGLEDQWDAVEVVPAELENRAKHGYLHYAIENHEEFKKLLGI